MKSDHTQLKCNPNCKQSDLGIIELTDVGLVTQTCWISLVLRGRKFWTCIYFIHIVKYMPCNYIINTHTTNTIAYWYKLVPKAQTKPEEAETKSLFWSQVVPGGFLFGPSQVAPSISTSKRDLWANSKNPHKLLLNPYKASAIWKYRRQIPVSETYWKIKFS